ncbi:MAG: extracellular solute-binding protein [Aggregatilineales bacterium]
MRISRLLLIGLLTCLFVAIAPVTAQQPTIITMTAPEYLSDLYEDTLIPAFEEAYPNIQVEFVYNENPYFGNPMYQSDSAENTYYEDLTNYVSSADVLYVTNYQLSPFATETGFILDLSPLVDVDADLNEADFFPAEWEAFQWDRGIWALPYSMNVQVLVYNMDAFDAAGLAYPDETWRVDDYINAAEALQTYNSQGEVDLSPLVAVNPMSLFYNAIGNVYDETSLPAQPDFSSPELLNILEAYAAYDAAYEFAEIQGYSFNELPMSIGYPYQLSTNSFGSDENINWGVSLLP